MAVEEHRRQPHRSLGGNRVVTWQVGVDQRPPALGSWRTEGGERTEVGLAPAAAKKPDAKPAAPAGTADQHAAAGEGAPSVEDIKKSMEEKNYREALQKLSRALSLKGPSAGQYDKHELLVLKAESQLNLKDVSGSAASFAAAAKEAKDDTARAQDSRVAAVAGSAGSIRISILPPSRPAAAMPAAS